MRRIRPSLSRRVGMIPGTIMEDGRQDLPAPELTLFRYNPQDAVQKDLTGAEDLANLQADRQNLWLNISRVHDAQLLQKISRAFGIHPIAAEDIQHTVQRPKAEEYEKQLFLILRMLSWNSETRSIEGEQVSIITGPGYVLSFQEHPGDVFDPVRRRILNGQGRIRTMGADYLAYALTDAIVDNYFLVLEALQEDFEALEEQVLFSDGPDPAKKVHAMTQELFTLRRAIWPMREAASALMRGQITAVSEEVQIYFRDIYDHVVQIMDWVEQMREGLKGLVDSYHARLSNSTNEVMRLLTIIATIFIPLTFIAGIYGMNFINMPELSWKLGYPSVLSGMLIIGVGMLIYFKRKKWL